MSALHDQKVASSNPAQQAQYAKEIEHGDHCECLILAAALGGDRKTVSFGFCRRVLQKHWSIKCRHGEIAKREEVQESGEKWSDLGEMDPVKAILIKNG